MEKPTLPKGTRDFGPAVMAKRTYILDVIKRVFRKYGFSPLETPAIENLTTLTGKYGEEGDQLLFKILNSGDYLKGVPSDLLATPDARRLAPVIAEKGLRYDLTVPFARYVVMNKSEIGMPFKRYQIQPVWRADRPQKGRYREFLQCDADIVGTSSLICEAEIILMIREVFAGLGVEKFTIKVNHRSILRGIAESIGARDLETPLLVAIDKLDKLGPEKVKAELADKGFPQEGITRLFDMLSVKGTSINKLAFLASRFATSPTGKKGLRDMKELLNLLTTFGAPDDAIEFDISLARGLSYYTGCIFEVKIEDADIGSVSGGGRYDNLTQAFGDKDNLSGVGFSFGVDRIYDALESLDLFPTESLVHTAICVCHFDATAQQYGIGVLSTLREAGIAAEIYPDIAKIKKQLDYVNRKRILYALVIGAEEIATEQLAFKNMTTGVQENATLQEIINKLRSVS
jgi:histidyl-tRNA synthetase